MLKLIAAAIAIFAVGIVSTAAFANCGAVHTPSPPQVQTPPPDSSS